MLAPDSVLKSITVEYNNPNNALLNSDALIRFLNFQLGAMQDSGEFIRYLANSFHHLENVIQFRKKEERKCSNCSYEYEFLYDDPTQHFFLLYTLEVPSPSEHLELLRHTDKSNKSKSLTMNDLLRHNSAMQEIPDFKCPVCDSCNVSRSLSIDYAGNVLMIIFNIFLYHRDRTVTRLPLRNRSCHNIEHWQFKIQTSLL